MSSVAAAKRIVCRAVLASEKWPSWVEVVAGEAGPQFAFYPATLGDPVAFAYVTSNGSVLIDRIVVDPTRRGLGFGTEAVELLEAEFPGKTFVARVDPAVGLNLYFWLRLGYRPVTSGEASAHSEGSGDMITMIREPILQQETT